MKGRERATSHGHSGQAQDLAFGGDRERGPLSGSEKQVSDDLVDTVEVQAGSWGETQMW